MKFKESNIYVGIVGLGYVGLPLAVNFGKKYPTTGFDLNKSRIKDLKEYNDETGEVTKEELKQSKKLSLTANPGDLLDCNIFIVAVPTPVDKNNIPDLRLLKSATTTVAKNLKNKDIVIFESTVYPGATEEECVPILEKVSGLKFNKNFFCGYSPERINPGDKQRTINDIVKVTSGSTEESANFIDGLYASIIKAGTYKAASIKVAEAAKVIENTQRDVNIGLINEFATIFNKLNIDTSDVLDAAATKWNFLNFSPGLVGGHCIGVDPYYLAYKANKIGLNPKVLLSGREVNEGMANYVSKNITDKLIENNFKIHQSKILIMGVTFKEDCPDLRNSKVGNIINDLKMLGAIVDCYDPVASKSEAKKDLGIELMDEFPKLKYDGIILAVKHKDFKKINPNDLKKICKKGGVIYDLKNFLPKNVSDLRL